MATRRGLAIPGKRSARETALHSSAALRPIGNHRQKCTAGQRRPFRMRRPTTLTSIIEGSARGAYALDADQERMRPREAVLTPSERVNRATQSGATR